MTGILVTTLVYFSIYLAVRRHKNQIQVLQVQNATQTSEIANFASFIKSAVREIRPHEQKNLACWIINFLLDVLLCSIAENFYSLFVF